MHCDFALVLLCRRCTTPANHALCQFGIFFIVFGFVDSIVLFSRPPFTIICFSIVQFFKMYLVLYSLTQYSTSALFNRSGEKLCCIILYSTSTSQLSSKLAKSITSVRNALVDLFCRKPFFCCRFAFRFRCVVSLFAVSVPR